MILSEDFIKVCRDLRVNRFMLCRSENKFEGKPYIKLFIELSVHGKPSDVHFEHPVDVDFQAFGEGNARKIEDYWVSFYETMYSAMDPIRTFLRSISKKTDVRFRVVAFNNSDNYVKAGFVGHQLYGIINNKEIYRLIEYAGPDNTASPLHVEHRHIKQVG